MAREGRKGKGRSGGEGRGETTRRRREETDGGSRKSKARRRNGKTREDRACRVRRGSLARKEGRKDNFQYQPLKRGDWRRGTWVVPVSEEKACSRDVARIRAMTLDGEDGTARHPERVQIADRASRRYVSSHRRRVANLQPPPPSPSRRFATNCCTIASATNLGYPPGNFDPQ